MKHTGLPILVLATVATVSPVIAGQFEPPPTIVVTSAERYVRVLVEADGEDHTDEVTSGAQGGPFVFPASDQLAGMLGSTASGGAMQNTVISSLSIRGSGSVSGEASLGGGEFPNVQAASDSRIFALFSIPEGTRYRLYGTLTAAGDSGGTCLSSAIVQLSTLHTHFVNCQTPVEQQDFFFCGYALDSSQAIAVEVNAFPDGTYQGQGTASFDFTFEVGVGSGDPCDTMDPDWDNDYDGLIDSWELDGIDFDGDGTPEIDLPGLGALPGSPDLFVEIDVMDGIPFDQEAVDDVVRAFAEAPGGQVGNLNGQPAINLVVVLDGDRPAQEPLVVLPNDLLPPDYYDIKHAYFGSADDRNHPDWDQIREVRLGIFRYGVWADTLVRNNGDQLWGLAEAIPSNDFVVAAGRMQSRSELANVLTEALAGIFMHELGHTLGLRHGGQENTPNYKPNYLSVMNYAYDVPMDTTTDQGTNGSEAWRLDYSRTALQTLNENELLEVDGLDGPPGRMILFNSAPQGFPSIINIGWAEADWVDWNSNTITDGFIYERDISNLTDASTSHDILDSYSDWDRLWIDAAGNSAFDDRQPWPYADRVIENGIDEESFLAIQNAAWIDQTALGDLVFANDFELGSTTAWSETVP